jgi:hypothetical protein
MTKVAIHLVAHNDLNGNPRRVFVVLNGDGLLEAIDEGYDGMNALYNRHPEMRRKIVVSFHITTAEYNQLTERAR